LADEPTGNLDSKTGAYVLETFQKLNEKGGHTIILITHDKYVADHANRIIEIKDGAIISDKKRV
jgi:ABC-type lipoprotein export system ATPase subunit